MARKTTKKPAKKTARKTASRGSGRSGSSARKTTKKSAVKKKPAAKKAGAKKVAKKKTKTKTKKPAKTAKKVAKKPVKKKAVSKVQPKKTTRKAPADKKTPPRKKRIGRGRALGARSVAEAASAGEADAQGYVYVNGRRVRMISTGGQGVPTRSRSAAVEKPAVVTPQTAQKPIKTKLTPKQLRQYRDMLLEKRGELIGDVKAMEKAALQARGGNLSNLPIHMADIGTDTYDQDFMLGLAETERERLHEIDDALRRIEDKTYGVCLTTRKPIPAARLSAKPWAKYTIEAARQAEGQWRA